MIQSTSLLEVFAEMGLLEAVLLHLSSVVSCVATWPTSLGCLAFVCM